MSTNYADAALMSVARMSDSAILTLPDPATFDAANAVVDRWLLSPLMVDSEDRSSARAFMRDLIESVDPTGVAADHYVIALARLIAAGKR